VKRTRTPDDFNAFGRGHLPGLIGVDRGEHRRGADRPFPLHADDPLAQVDNPPPFVFESLVMPRRFFSFFFFYFPRLAEGTG
jgi:hypothetical protein